MERQCVIVRLRKPDPNGARGSIANLGGYRADPLVVRAEGVSEVCDFVP
jgi:hypothetical protein